MKPPKLNTRDEGSTNPGKPHHDEYQAHAGDTPSYPMQVYNGLITPRPHRIVGDGEATWEPRQFRRFVSTGAADVQIKNPIDHGKRGFGVRIPWITYLYAANSRMMIGATRNSNSGWLPKVSRQIDPLTWRNKIWNGGPGSQPSNPGQPGAVAATHLINPMTS